MVSNNNNNTEIVKLMREETQQLLFDNKNYFANKIHRRIQKDKTQNAN